MILSFLFLLERHLSDVQVDLPFVRSENKLRFLRILRLLLVLPTDTRQKSLTSKCRHDTLHRIRIESCALVNRPTLYREEFLCLR